MNACFAINNFTIAHKKKIFYELTSKQLTEQ